MTMEYPDNNLGWIGATAVVVAATVTGFFTWLARRSPRRGGQELVQDGFGSLVDRLEALVENLQRERLELVRTIADQAMEITALRGSVRQLTQTVLSMERVMMQHGLNVPAMKHDPLTAESLRNNPLDGDDPEM